MTDLPLHPVVLLGLLVAVSAVVVALARIAEAVSTPAWPLTEGLTTPDTRGRDLELAHMVRVLRAKHHDEAHRLLTEIVRLRLASEHGIDLTDPRAADLLGADVARFLHAPPAAPDDYLKALDAVLSRLERT